MISAAVAHAVTTVFDRGVGASTWLQGRYGPPFFNVALFMGVLYGGIAYALTRRAKDAAVGLLGPLLGIAVPLTVLERVHDFPWYYVVIAVFVVSVWGTIALLGRRMGSAWGGVLGAFAGYVCLSGIAAATPRLMNWPIPLYRYLPTPAVLLDGLLTGAGIAAGVTLLRRKHA